MMRNALAVLLVAVVGCKGETVVKPDPATLSELERCKADMAEKDKLIKAVEGENARLMRNQGTGAEITVSIEGTALTVKPGKPGEVRPIDDKAVAAASSEFIDLVAKSRGAIQKCYEQALKKNAGLQARTITLNVSASFTPDGAYKSSATSPTLGDVFDACIKTVASKWQLNNKPPVTTFKAQVSLTPS